ncbi:SIR2 family protein [Chryseobacterium hispalense]|uniref:SIR2 family protein n=1 Tax=Chryseobacterium hispalense TaxID=1453492 RepID=UPI0039196FC2
MKKLLIITGAGASVDFGMPKVSEIDVFFEEWAKDISSLKNNSNKSLYSWVKEKMIDYVEKNKSNRQEQIINFENILYTIQNIYIFLNDKNNDLYKNRLSPFANIDVSDIPDIIRFGREKKTEAYDFHFLHSYLVDKLLEYFRDKCKKLEIDKPEELLISKSFFEKLKSKFEIGIANLNYDNVILSSLSDLKTGFNKQGKFKRSLLYNGEWYFCYHLHGSVFFDMQGGDDNTEMHKICWNNNLNSKFAQNSSGRSGNYTNEGLDHLNSNIIMGLDKTNQLLREPFMSYYMQLDKLIYEADAILFIGYGFNDLHLNNTFSFIRYDKEKTRKVVVIDYASDNEDGLSFRSDAWSFGLLQTLPSNAYQMGAETTSLPQPVSFFKKRNILEKSKNKDLPLAIWYNGFIEACKNPDKILKELL